MNKIINENCVFCKNGYLIEDVCSKTGTIYYYCGCCLKYKEIKKDLDVVELFSSAEIDLDEYFSSLIGKGED